VFIATRINRSKSPVLDNLPTPSYDLFPFIKNYGSVFGGTCHENAQFPLRNSEVGIAAIHADTHLREYPYDWLLQTLYSGEMDCKLTIELSVIFASTLVARHDYNLHSAIDFPEKP
jgi:hypothetical protein